MVRLHANRFLLPFLAIAAMMMGCEWKEPVLPAWETKIKIPLYEKFVMGEELGNDSLVIRPNPNDPDSLLFLSIEDSLDFFSLSLKDLSVSVDDSTGSVRLDTLEIDSLNATVDLAGETVFPGISNRVGQTVVLPDTVMGPLEFSANSADFESITFLSGDVHLRVTNRLPLTIGANSVSAEGLRVRIFTDGLQQEVFADILFSEEIPPGETRDAVVNVTDKTLQAPVDLEALVPLHAGQFLVTEDLLQTMGVGIEVILENIRADELTGRLPAQYYEDVTQIGYDDDLRLREAIVDSGSIAIEFRNHVDIASLVDLEIPALVDRITGLPYQTSIQLDAAGSGTILLSIENYRVSNPNLPGSLLDSLELRINGQTLETGEFVTVSGDDSLEFSVVADTFYFSEFSGRIANEIVEIDPVEVNDIIDYGNFDGDLTLSDAILQLTVFSEIQIDDLSGDIEIVALHRENGVATDSATLVLNNQAINGGSTENPGITLITLQGQEVVEMLNILPTDIKFRGEVGLSGEASVSIGNRIWADYVFDTPLRARLEGITPFEADLKTLDEDNLVDVVQESADENILGVALTFELTNQTPLGGELVFALTSDPADTNLFDAPIDTALGFTRSLTLTPAPSDPTSGFVTTPRVETVNLGLSRREIRFFTTPPLFYSLQLRVADTDGQVAIRSFDFVETSGNIELRLRVDDNE
ncbi:MAG TPA: hypothetical protein PLG66_14900 [Calditrichia bacterium]|nr:hypothetical protein [Calditrichia bacterium]